MTRNRRGPASDRHALAGGKYTDWEGGVRTNAWVSGGFVPENRQSLAHPAACLD